MDPLRGCAGIPPRPGRAFLSGAGTPRSTAAERKTGVGADPCVGPCACPPAKTRVVIPAHAGIQNVPESPVVSNLPAHALRGNADATERVPPWPRLAIPRHRRRERHLSPPGAGLPVRCRNTPTRRREKNRCRGRPLCRPVCLSTGKKGESSFRRTRESRMCPNRPLSLICRSMLSGAMRTRQSASLHGRDWQYRVTGGGTGIPPRPKRACLSGVQGNGRGRT